MTDRVWAAVQDANMNGKLWSHDEVQVVMEDPYDRTWERLNPSGSPPHYIVKDGQGKVQKPPSFRPADISRVLDAQRFERGGTVAGAGRVIGQPGGQPVA